MLLTIQEERHAIAAQMRLVDRLRRNYTAPPNCSSEIGEFRAVQKLIERHMDELAAVELKKEEYVIVEPYLEASLRIRNHIVRKAQQMRQLLTDPPIQPYAALAVRSLAKIIYNLTQIEEKLATLQ
jgi:hypothetical protein